jgi:GrpB-like predicted nucleotidyltransferase (UPF0157 family)
MITKDQQKWLNHLSETDRVVIKKFDPKSSEIFEEVKKKIIKALGKVKVFHRGASYLKISGQDEIDIYVPVVPNDFDITVAKMSSTFGEPRSNYPLVRARFHLDGYGKNIDVFVINEKDAGWINSEIFTNWLLTHKETLEKYKKLKEEGVGLSTREYYTIKTGFINGVLEIAKKK